MSASGQRIGYARVSTIDQNTARQLAGVKVDRLFTDRASGSTVDRPELKRLLAFARDGDTVVVHSIDRLARNLDHLRTIVFDLTGRGVTVEFVTERLTFSPAKASPIANMLLSVMGSLAEFERAILRERQREGIAAARARGAYRGRRRALSADQVEELRKRMAADPPPSKAELARAFGVSRQTLYKYLDDDAGELPPVERV